METKLTFDEELAVSSAISLRILHLSSTIEEGRVLHLDTHSLCEIRHSLMSAFRKLTGVEYKSIIH